MRTHRWKPIIIIVISVSLLTCGTHGSIRVSLGEARTYCGEVRFPAPWRQEDGLNWSMGLLFRRVRGTLRFPVAASASGDGMPSTNFFLVDLSGSPRVEPSTREVWDNAEKSSPQPPEDQLFDEHKSWLAGTVLWAGRQYKVSGSGHVVDRTVIPSPNQKWVALQTVDPGWFQPGYFFSSGSRPAYDAMHGTAYVDVYSAAAYQKSFTIKASFGGGVRVFTTETRWLTDELLAVRSDYEDRSVLICRVPSKNETENINV